MKFSWNHEKSAYTRDKRDLNAYKYPYSNLLFLCYRVYHNYMYKLRGFFENFVRNHNYIRNYGRKWIGALYVSSKSRHMWLPHCWCRLLVTNMNLFQERRVDGLHFVYGVANGNGRVTVWLYQERYPWKRKQNHKMFAWVYWKWIESGSFTANKQDIGRPRTSRTHP